MTDEMMHVDNKLVSRDDDDDNLLEESLKFT